MPFVIKKAHAFVISFDPSFLIWLKHKSSNEFKMWPNLTMNAKVTPLEPILDLISTLELSP